MKLLRAVNNFLASATLTLAITIIFIMVAALFLSATTRFITGTGEGMLDSKNMRPHLF